MVPRWNWIDSITGLTYPWTLGHSCGQRGIGGAQGLLRDGSDASTSARCTPLSRSCLLWKGFRTRFTTKPHGLRSQLTTLKVLIKESAAICCQEHLKRLFSDLGSKLRCATHSRSVGAGSSLLHESQSNAITGYNNLYV